MAKTPPEEMLIIRNNIKEIKKEPISDTPFIETLSLLNALARNKKVLSKEH